MVRGGRYSSRGSYRGSSSGSYRGSSRGNPWGGGGYRGGSRERYSSFEGGGFNKGSRFSEGRYPRDDFPKAYRMDSYSRERHSPERKRPRNEGPSRHEYVGGRYDSFSERRSYSNERERHMSSPYTSRREEFRKPLPPPSPRGGGRGRLSSRGPRGLRRDRGGGPPRRRLAESSYAIRKRGMIRSGEFSRRSSKSIRVRSSLTRRRRAALSSEKESSGDEENDVKTTEKAEKDGDEDAEMKEPGAEIEGGAIKEEKEAGEVDVKPKPKESKEKKSEVGGKPRGIKNFIKLICPQCNLNVTTFRRYEAHLEGKTHLFAMRKVAAKQRSILAQMRQAQRNSQNEMEKTGEGITDHTVFCPLCKLNYKQERAVHQATAAHKNMKKFLMPTCKVCKQTFKSPMVYEHHLCTIEHIKNKQRADTAGEAAEEDNLDEFTTIDSVGEVGDDNTGSAEEEHEKEERKKRVSVGIEQIKKIDAYYCDLCRMFLPRGTENEYPDILAGHCRKRFHMQRYIRFKENEDLKKRAEKLQRKETAEREKKKDDVKSEGDAPMAADVKEESKDGDESKELDSSKIADDDKMWDAVDKDLGELLEETDGREDDDDEERINGERFDRFRSAEKEKNGEAGEAAGETSTVEENKKTEETKK